MAAVPRPFASTMMVGDLVEVERQLGFDYAIEGHPGDSSLSAGLPAVPAGAVRTRAKAELWAIRRANSGGTSGISRRWPLSRSTKPRIIERFGPHLSAMDRRAARHRDRTGPAGASTHCCFCGQQCGIHLKVKDNEVIGFEPWEEFPFNRGMLCPKGVKRYLQGSHPDRLLTALRRDTTSASAVQPRAVRGRNRPRRVGD